MHNFKSLFSPLEPAKFNVTLTFLFSVHVLIESFIKNTKKDTLSNICLNAKLCSCRLANSYYFAIGYFQKNSDI